MKEDRVESYSELEQAISNIKTLSDEITATFNHSNNIFAGQNEAWHSSNSTTQANKMMDYSQEAGKIAKNVNEVSESIQKYKTTTQNIDEQK